MVKVVLISYILKREETGKLYKVQRMEEMTNLTNRNVFLNLTNFQVLNRYLNGFGTKKYSLLLILKIFNSQT